MGIALWSPPLDISGNSVRGIEFCKVLQRPSSWIHTEAILNLSTVFLYSIVVIDWIVCLSSNWCRCSTSTGTTIWSTRWTSRIRAGTSTRRKGWTSSACCSRPPPATWRPCAATNSPASTWRRRTTITAPRSIWPPLRATSNASSSSSSTATSHPTPSTGKNPPAAIQPPISLTSDLIADGDRHPRRTRCASATL